MNVPDLSLVVMIDLNVRINVGRSVGNLENYLIIWKPYSTPA